MSRGIRTARRWERDLGMPVHRLSTGAGEAVFAWRAELDAWIVRQSRSNLAPTAADGDTPNGYDGRNGHAGRDHEVPARVAQPTFTDSALGQHEPGSALERPRGTSWRWAGLVMSLALVLVAATAWSVLGPAPEPASVEFSGKTMAVYDSQHARLWDAGFDVPLQEFSSSIHVNRGVAIGDIDRDGHNDVVVARNDTADARVYAWSHRGERRFAHTFDRPVRFGEYACPPVYPTHVLIEARPPFVGALWVWGQHPLFFPAVLQRLDAEGRVLSEYWSNGFIGSVLSVTLGERPVTLVGAANNERRGASLALFYGDVAGSAPAQTPDYQCQGCPSGNPDVFLVTGWDTIAGPETAAESKPEATKRPPA
jgi:hypothetical protein